MNYIICPFINNWPLTLNAVQDMLEQTIPTKVILIDNGADPEVNAQAKAFSSSHDRVLFITHNPPLPSLAATWNMAMNVVWDLGEDYVLVCNNDVRLRPDTYEHLVNVFEDQLEPETPDIRFMITAIGRREDTWFEDRNREITWEELSTGNRGGPDFSCYLFTKAMHKQFAFDENFIPAYTEDCDMHRRIMLAGLGLHCFSVNLPYLHYASQSLKTMDPKKREKLESAIENGSRAYYLKKWGGGVNEEKFLVPFTTYSGDGNCTKTNDLHNHGCWIVNGDHTELEKAKI